MNLSNLVCQGHKTGSDFAKQGASIKSCEIFFGSDPVLHQLCESGYNGTTSINLAPICVPLVEKPPSEMNARNFKNNLKPKMKSNQKQQREKLKMSGSIQTYEDPDDETCPIVACGYFEPSLPNTMQIFSDFNQNGAKKEGKIRWSNGLEWDVITTDATSCEQRDACVQGFPIIDDDGNVFEDGVYYIPGVPGGCAPRGQKCRFPDKSSQKK